jgi:hypothetical protein
MNYVAEYSMMYHLTVLVTLNAILNLKDRKFLYCFLIPLLLFSPSNTLHVISLDSPYIFAAIVTRSI